MSDNSNYLHGHSANTQRLAVNEFSDDRRSSYEDLKQGHSATSGYTELKHTCLKCDQGLVATNQNDIGITLISEVTDWSGSKKATKGGPTKFSNETRESFRNTNANTDDADVNVYMELQETVFADNETRRSSHFAGRLSRFDGYLSPIHTSELDLSAINQRQHTETNSLDSHVYAEIAPKPVQKGNKTNTETQQSCKKRLVCLIVFGILILVAATMAVLVLTVFKKESTTKSTTTSAATMTTTQSATMTETSAEEMAKTSAATMTKTFAATMTTTSAAVTTTSAAVTKTSAAAMTTTSAETMTTASAAVTTTSAATITTTSAEEMTTTSTAAITTTPAAAVTTTISANQVVFTSTQQSIEAGCTVFLKCSVSAVNWRDIAIIKTNNDASTGPHVVLVNVHQRHGDLLKTYNVTVNLSATNFSVNSANIEITLRNVNFEDEGEYACMVDVTNPENVDIADLNSAKTQITVIAHPTSLTIEAPLLLFEKLNHTVACSLVTDLGNLRDFQIQTKVSNDNQFRQVLKRTNYAAISPDCYHRAVLTWSFSAETVENDTDVRCLIVKLSGERISSNSVTMYKVTSYVTMHSAAFNFEIGTTERIVCDILNIVGMNSIVLTRSASDPEIVVRITNLADETPSVDTNFSSIQVDTGMTTYKDNGAHVVVVFSPVNCSEADSNGSVYTFAALDSNGEVIKSDASIIVITTISVCVCPLMYRYDSNTDACIEDQVVFTSTQQFIKAGCTVFLKCSVSAVNWRDISIIKINNDASTGPHVVLVMVHQKDGDVLKTYNVIVYLTKTNFSVNSAVIEIVLPNVIPEDEGEYACMVDVTNPENVDMLTDFSSAKTQFTVIAHPTSLTIEAPSLLFENLNHTVECKVEMSRGTYNRKYYIQTKVLNENQFESVTEGVTYAGTSPDCYNRIVWTWSFSADTVENGTDVRCLIVNYLNATESTDSVTMYKVTSYVTMHSPAFNFEIGTTERIVCDILNIVDMHSIVLTRSASDPEVVVRITNLADETPSVDTNFSSIQVDTGMTTYKDAGAHVVVVFSPVNCSDADSNGSVYTCAALDSNGEVIKSDASIIVITKLPKVVLDFPVQIREDRWTLDIGCDAVLGFPRRDLTFLLKRADDSIFSPYVPEVLIHVDLRWENSTSGDDDCVEIVRYEFDMDTVAEVWNNTHIQCAVGYGTDDEVLSEIGVFQVVPKSVCDGLPENTFVFHPYNCSLVVQCRGEANKDGEWAYIHPTTCSNGECWISGTLDEPVCDKNV